MPLYYAMLCKALQGAVLKLSFLAEPHQPNRHDNQMILVDDFEGDKSDTPTTYGNPWHGLDHEPAYDHNHKYDHAPDSHGLSNHDPDLGPQHFMQVGCSSTT